MKYKKLVEELRVRSARFAFMEHYGNANLLDSAADAIEALEKDEETKWHDVRANNDDVPDIAFDGYWTHYNEDGSIECDENIAIFKSQRLLFCSKVNGEREMFLGYYFEFEYYDGESHDGDYFEYKTDGGIRVLDVIAWRYIDEFK